MGLSLSLSPLIYLSVPSSSLRSPWIDKKEARGAHTGRGRRDVEPQLRERRQ